MATTTLQKRQVKDKIGKVKDFSKHPFFVKKAKEAARFLKKNGLPASAKK